MYCIYTKSKMKCQVVARSCLDIPGPQLNDSMVIVLLSIIATYILVYQDCVLRYMPCPTAQHLSNREQRQAPDSLPAHVHRAGYMTSKQVGNLSNRNTKETPCRWSHKKSRSGIVYEKWPFTHCMRSESHPAWIARKWTPNSSSG